MRIEKVPFNLFRTAYLEALEWVIPEPSVPRHQKPEIACVATVKAFKKPSEEEVASYTGPIQSWCSAEGKSFAGLLRTCLGFEVLTVRTSAKRDREEKWESALGRLACSEGIPLQHAEAHILEMIKELPGVMRISSWSAFHSISPSEALSVDPFVEPIKAVEEWDDPQFRQVFERCVEQGRSSRAAAEELGLTEKVVRRIRRQVKALAGFVHHEALLGRSRHESVPRYELAHEGRLQESAKRDQVQSRFQQIMEEHDANWERALAMVAREYPELDDTKLQEWVECRG